MAHYLKTIRVRSGLVGWMHQSLQANGTYATPDNVSAADEKDTLGNTCNFKSMVNTEKDHPQRSKDGRWACDFNLVVKQ